MKLVFASSPSHDILKRHIFLGTLCDEWELIEMRFHVVGSGDFNTAGWNRVVLERIAMMRQIIADSKDELVVFSDVDIQWFRSAQKPLTQALETNDLVFQRECAGRDEANCGFVAVRCNEKTLAFFTRVANAAQEGHHDQASTNELIASGEMPCRFGFLPDSFYNDNLMGKWKRLREEIIMYHTIGTLPQSDKTSIQIKLERHLAMRGWILGSRKVFCGVPGSDILVATNPARYRLRRTSPGSEQNAECEKGLKHP